MTTVRDILSFIESIAPVSMKEDWDHVGLNCGHLDKEVHTVLVALDPFKNVCKEAKDIGADLLVTHHALLWNQGFITDADQQGKNALYLIENGIAHINAHTNLDCAPGGVNDVLASVLGLAKVQVIEPQGTDDNGNEWGLLRQGVVPEQTLAAFLSKVKAALDCPVLKYVAGDKLVHNVAVGGGACCSELQSVADAGCDTFVTSDIKYNQFWDAQALGINLIDAGHFYTENPVCAALAQKLAAAFPEVQVKRSQKHKDCASFF